MTFATQRGGGGGEGQLTSSLGGSSHHRHFWSSKAKQTSNGASSSEDKGAEAASTSSTEGKKKGEEGGTSSPEASSSAAAAGKPAEGSSEESGEAPSPTAEEYEALVKQIKEAAVKEVKLSDQVKDLTDRLMRSLAEMENVRTRSAREVDNAKRFGPQAMIKDLLDVPDNLERAAASVPQAVIDGGEAADADKLKALLRGLLEGVRATEKILMQVLRKQGVERFDPMGEKFDPNLHSALFEVPDGTKEAGTVAVVTKKGYRLHERVIRPADVGVTRVP